MVSSTEPRERQPLFALDTLAPSDHVLIDGVSYAVADPDALGLIELVKQQRLEDRIVALEKATAPSEDEAAEYDAKLRELTRRIVPSIPDDVLAKMQPGHMTGLAAAFIVRRARSSAPTPPSSSSPVSPTSTAAESGS